VTAAARGRLAPPGEAPANGERTTDLAEGRGFRVEQILSGPLDAPQSYAQDHDEWVVLLAGRAVLEVDGERHPLVPGDWWLLPAGTPHRLLRTEAGSSWLAVRTSGREERA
jgi:cupin 2 domain-containing protein